MSDLPVGASIESSDKLDDIAAGVTSGEASPEVLVARDHESAWIVAAVDGAGSGEGMSLSAHASEQASLGEDLLDGDESFETAEAQMSRDHELISRFRFRGGRKGLRERETEITTRRAGSRSGS